MHRRKHLPSIAQASSESLPAKQIYRFDALDWIAAALVLATPVFIVYRLIFG